MIINLNQEEIYQAIRDSIEAQNIPLAGRDVTVTLTAGRSGNGHKAQIVLTPKGSAEASSGDDKAETKSTPDEEPALNFDD